MKKIRFIAFLFMAVLGVGTAFAGAQDFTLVNATEHTILSVYISSSGSNIWGPDRLNGYLTPGDWTEFTFTGYDDDLWDIRIVYLDNKPDAVFTRLSLTTLFKLVLRDNALGGTTMTPHVL